MLLECEQVRESYPWYSAQRTLDFRIDINWWRLAEIIAENCSLENAVDAVGAEVEVGCTDEGVPVGIVGHWKRSFTCRQAFLSKSLQVFPRLRRGSERDSSWRRHRSRTFCWDAFLYLRQLGSGMARLK